MRPQHLSCFLLATLAGFAETPGSVTVIRQAAPVKALVFEVVIPAKVADVWQAFTTSPGLVTWLAPEAVADLRQGGEWTVRFPGASTGGGTILSYVPQREIVIAAMAPDRFPTVRAERTRAKFEFEAQGEATLVRLTQTGWKAGKEWDEAYEYLAAGNAQLLEALKRRFVDGPLDWAKWGVKK